MDAWSTVGVEEGAGRTAFSERHLLAPPGTTCVSGSSTSSYSNVTKEEIELEGNTLAEPLSWDSNSDLSGSKIHALSSGQAAIQEDTHCSLKE